MRIVIDMQGAQTESRFRGIGRYTLAFAEAVVRNRGDHEIILALNGLFPETIEPIRAAFDSFLPQKNIRVWHAPGPVSEEQYGNESRREAAECIREAFFASLRPDVIHISSLFEGYVEDAVTSIGRLDGRIPVSVTLHDLIPLLNPQDYLKPSPRYEKFYRRKIEFLNNAACYLAISESSKEEGERFLDAPNALFINTMEAVDDSFCKIEISKEVSRDLLSKFGIRHPFVLYTGGADRRKNLPRLLRSYAALPDSLRTTHQLVFAGKMPQGEIVRLKSIAKSAGLLDSELVFTSYVSDEELVQLYNLCKLYVFPSWHEGFGLPALEAMACGAPVIGADSSSLPEVIGLKDALFDPLDVSAISAKLAQGLEDNAFRDRLKEHGLEQAKTFSWDETAKRAIFAWESLPGRSPADYLIQSQAVDQLELALKPTLLKKNDQELIVLADCIAKNKSAGIERQLLLDVSELCQRDAATGVQRVVRSYLKWLLQNPPKDFRVEPVFATANQDYRYARRFTQQFLGSEGLAEVEDSPIRWQRGDIFFGLDMQHHTQLGNAEFFSLIRSEGVIVKFLIHDLLPIEMPECFHNSQDTKYLHEEWLRLIASTDGAICVSEATAKAYCDWLCQNAVNTEPTFRVSWVHNGGDIEGSQPSRGLPDEAPRVIQELRCRPSFLCVSTIEPRKRQDQILEAAEVLWEKGFDINLVLVGKLGWKSETLAEKLGSHPELGRRLFWMQGISDEYLDKVYSASSCLVAASINEGFGLSLIEAAQRSVPIVARDIAVFREVAGEHADYFKGDTGQELADALIEWLKKYRHGQVVPSSGMPWLSWEQCTERLKKELIDRNAKHRQLLVDISELVQHDVRTGVHRVVRSVLSEWLSTPPEGYAVEPVYASVEHGYRYARQFTQEFLGIADVGARDEPIEYAPGDVFFGLDLNHHVPRVHRNFLEEMYRHGVDVKFMVYDILPLQFPEFWEPRHSVDQVVEEWLSVIGRLGGAVCISKSVANDLTQWIGQNGPSRQRPFSIDYFHLGADIDESLGTKGMPAESRRILEIIGDSPSFLMVGTLEPRKGHSQVLEAFEELWRSNLGVNLVLIGKQGWMVEQLAERLRSHPELNKRLFWLEGISDEYLGEVYRASTCLIAASYGEGFGLPLIEAAQHKIPIIARDIPVFREVAGGHAFYFDSNTPSGLAAEIKEWLGLYEKREHPASDDMPWLTWKESARNLVSIILYGSRQIEIPNEDRVLLTERQVL